MPDSSVPEQWKKNLDDAVTITTAMMLKHAEMVKDQQVWLESHTLALSAHSLAIRSFDEGMEELRAIQERSAKRHDKEMAEIREALKDLTKRLGGGGNGHGQK